MLWMIVAVDTVWNVITCYDKGRNGMVTKLRSTISAVGIACEKQDISNSMYSCVKKYTKRKLVLRSRPLATKLS
eukprot:snap_masked-scaffold_10-processed-gene-1.41-mRNA-1 protein AED:1.00 eAED:1.00 QI:0/0/0/0/1/1/2/0/73